MAQYKGWLRGNRKATTRLGTKSSGIHAILNSWNIGVMISIRHIDGKDLVTITETGGTNHIQKDKKFHIDFGE